jgi:hypothetical protein
MVMVFGWWKKRSAEPSKSVVAVEAPVKSDSSDLSRSASSDLEPEQRTETVVAELPTGNPVRLEIPHDKISARAFEIWVRRGRKSGTGFQDWVDAEAELRAELQGQVPEALPNQPR